MALTADTPGSAATSLDERREERRARLGRGLIGAIERHACRHKPVGRKPEVDVLKVHERAREEHRRGGQHEGRASPPRRPASPGPGCLLGCPRRCAWTAARRRRRRDPGASRAPRSPTTAASVATATANASTGRRQRDDRVRRQAVGWQRARKQQRPARRAGEPATGAEDPHQQAFDERTTQQPCIGGAQRGSNRQLRLPARHPSDDEHREVDRGDQQQPGRQAEHREQQRADRPDRLLLRGASRLVVSPVLVSGQSRASRVVDRGQLRARLVERDAVARAARRRAAIGRPDRWRDRPATAGTHASALVCQNGANRNAGGMTPIDAIRLAVDDNRAPDHGQRRRRSGGPTAGGRARRRGHRRSRRLRRWCGRAAAARRARRTACPMTCSAGTRSVRPSAVRLAPHDCAAAMPLNDRVVAADVVEVGRRHGALTERPCRIVTRRSGCR